MKSIKNYALNIALNKLNLKKLNSSKNLKIRNKIKSTLLEIIPKYHNKNKNEGFIDTITNIGRITYGTISVLTHLLIYLIAGYKGLDFVDNLFSSNKKDNNATNHTRFKNLDFYLGLIDLGDVSEYTMSLIHKEKVYIYREYVESMFVYEIIPIIIKESCKKNKSKLINKIKTLSDNQQKKNLKILDGALSINDTYNSFQSNSIKIIDNFIKSKNNNPNEVKEAKLLKEIVFKKYYKQIINKFEKEVDDNIKLFINQ